MLHHCDVFTDCNPHLNCSIAGWTIIEFTDCKKIKENKKWLIGGWFQAMGLIFEKV